MTFDQLNKVFQVCHGNSNKVVISDLLNALNSIESTLSNRIEFVNFLNQCIFETQVFSRFEENLYYSTPTRLKAVWPSLFNSKYNPEEYIKNPEKLGNLVYANKLGNGNVLSGDGYRFRGRGAFHLTGRLNYQQCSLDLYQDMRLVDNPALVTNLNIGFKSSLWYWKKNGCDKLVTEEGCSKITKKITGCLLTEKERNDQLLKLKQIII